MIKSIKFIGHLFIIYGVCFGGIIWAESVDIQYTPLTEKEYKPKEGYFRVLEDHDLEIHQRPIEVIGTLLASGSTKNGTDWRKLEDHVAEFIKVRGADSIIDLEKQELPDHSAAPEVDEPFKSLTLKCQLIVYLDKDSYGHMGFWYNNRLEGIRGIRIEHVIKRSPAELAGLLKGDIVKGVSGENIGNIVIDNKKHYKAVQYKFIPNHEYQILIERNTRPKVLKIVPRTEDRVFDWSKRLGGV